MLSRRRAYTSTAGNEIGWSDRAERVYTVRCTWDTEAEVWVATSDDVPGLATGADTLEVLIDKLKVVIPDLLEANSVLLGDGSEDVPFAVIAERHERAPPER